MADADYVYRPMSAEQRKRISESNRRIRGIPKGYRQLFGVNVPERQFDEIKPLASYVRRKLPDDIEAVQSLIRLLVRMRPLVQPEERKRLMVALMVLSALDARREARRQR